MHTATALRPCGGVALRRPPAAGRPVRAGRPASVVSAAPEQAEAAPPAAGVEDCDENIMEFCSLDAGGKRPTGKKTLGEKEQDFIEALRAFYYDGKPSMSNEEFELLKEELTWEGSKVAVLSGDELRFLEAALAFQAGKPVMSDADYDALKVSLRSADSFVTQQGPRCSLRSKRVFANARPDYLKMTALNLPAAVLTLAALFAADDLTGFEITKLVELPEPFGILIVWGFVLPIVYVIASAITGAIIRDPLILKAPCPNCGAGTQSFFGDILTVAGNATEAEVACGACGAKLQFDRAAREVTLLEGPPPPKAA